MNKRYCVYRIYCSANGKSYVGQTDDINRRMNEHFGQLANWKHKNSHLQRAYLQYDHDTFWSEVLEKNITAEFIDEREKYWIRHLDSFRNGFNQTEGGDTSHIHSISVLWNGIQYESIAEAARTLGICSRSMSNRIKKGYKCDIDVPVAGRTKITVLWNGIQYESIAEAARVLGINQSTMFGRISKGYTCETDVTTPGCPRITVSWNGIQYESICAAARALEIHESAMRERIMRGYTCDDELKRGKRQCSK